jgi:hypothetical protein
MGNQTSRWYQGSPANSDNGRVSRETTGKNSTGNESTKSGGNTTTAKDESSNFFGFSKFKPPLDKSSDAIMEQFKQKVSDQDSHGSLQMERIKQFSASVHVLDSAGVES